jgi:hypothetical protein
MSKSARSDREWFVPRLLYARARGRKALRTIIRPHLRAQDKSDIVPVGAASFSQSEFVGLFGFFDLTFAINWGLIHFARSIFPGWRFAHIWRTMKTAKLAFKSGIIERDVAFREGRWVVAAEGQGTV